MLLLLCILIHYINLVGGLDHFFYFPELIWDVIPTALTKPDLAGWGIGGPGQEGDIMGRCVAWCSTNIKSWLIYDG